MSGRVMVVAVDGGEFSLIRRWTEEGRLPELAGLLKDGSAGLLRSTIPPITGAAWSSFQTGTNPGKHGVFNWFKRAAGGYRAQPVNSRQIKQPNLWQIIGALEKRVGIISVPVTYPPEPVNGFIIPGLLTPARGEKQSYPPELIKEIKSIAPTFKFSPKEWTRGYHPRPWVEELIHDIGVKTGVAEYLMEKKDWDFMMVHFMETDQVQHFMWHYLEEGGEWNPVAEVYQAVDRALGSIRSRLKREDTLLIMSDHGFGPLKYNFHIDTWLLEEGYLKLKSNPAACLKRAAFRAGLTKENLYPLGEYLYPLLRKAGLLETVLDLAGNPWLERLFLSSQNVDWSRSLAYSHSEIGHIYLNRKNREPLGVLAEGEAERVREELMEKLKTLVNPFTGKRITSQVMRGEDVYQGDRVEQAPDIVFLPDDFQILGKGAYDFLANRRVSRSRSQSGHHRMDGVLIGQGPGIRAGQRIEGARIIDLAPTILYLLGLPVLDQMDGQILRSLFEDEQLAAREERMTTREELGLKSSYDDDDTGEEEELRKRLKGLGYVS